MGARASFRNCLGQDDRLVSLQRRVVAPREERRIPRLLPSPIRRRGLSGMPSRTFHSAPSQGRSPVLSPRGFSRLASMTMARRTQLLTLAVALLALGACRATEEKRVYQYLNTQGFGKPTAGNANDANYVVVGDTILIRDELN